MLRKTFSSYKSLKGFEILFMFLLAGLAILNSLAQTKVGMEAKSGAGDKIGG